MKVFISLIVHNQNINKGHGLALTNIIVMKWDTCSFCKVPLSMCCITNNTWRHLYHIQCFWPPHVWEVVIIWRVCSAISSSQSINFDHLKWNWIVNPNTIKSYKILQKLSPKHAAHGVAQSTYPIYRHGKACLSKQPPWRAAGDPRLARGRSRVRAPGPAGTLRVLFFSTLPSSFGRYM